MQRSDDAGLKGPQPNKALGLRTDLSAVSHKHGDSINGLAALTAILMELRNYVSRL